MGHTLRSWTARTFHHVVEIELLAGARAIDGVAQSRALLDELLAEAYGGDDHGVRDVIERVYRAVARTEPPDPAQGRAESIVRDGLEHHLRNGQLHLTAQERPRLWSPRLGDGLISPFDDDPPPEPPPPTTTWFELRVVDEVGDAIDGVEIEFEVLGETQTVTTDGDGVARLDGMEGGQALARVKNPSRLRDKLKPRWQQPREPVLPESTAEAPAEFEVLDDHFDPVRCKRELRTTLVILPRFSCREIAAVTFDFGRSFVRREGIVPMAAIAQELHQDDGQLAWIFGHTDISGSDKLNKRLSERRAEAIFAVFTHDFARWDALWKGEPKGSPWSESWGTREVQHMLNALGCTDDAGNTLGEDGDNGSKTKQAVRRFKRKDYPSVPAEQADLPDDSTIDAATREQLFFAYAKLIGREPVDVARIAKVGDAPFMGCGEYNPLSLSVKDRESRRAVVFVFDPAAQPQAPPCVLGSIDACKGTLDPPPAADAEPPFYRCSFYREVASCCQSAGGADLAHDVIVRFFFDLKTADGLGHSFVLEAQDMPDDDTPAVAFSQTQALAGDAREVVAEGTPSDDPEQPDTPPDPAAPAMVELHFTHVPDAAKYRLRVEGVAEPYAIFEHTPFHLISELSRPLDLLRMPRLWAILHAPPPAAPDPSDPGATR